MKDSWELKPTKELYLNRYSLLSKGQLEGLKEDLILRLKDQEELKNEYPTHKRAKRAPFLRQIKIYKKQLSAALELLKNSSE